MRSDFYKSTRRTVLKTTVAVLCCAKTGLASASPSRTIDQITDPGATAAKNMFRFEPDFIRLSPGDELTFLNSRSQHTVHSVPELWPEDAPLVKIANKDEVTVKFEQEGYYGFRCQRHGQYGMVMLVAVGTAGSTLPLRPIVETMKAKRRERAGFLDLLDRFDRS